MAAVTGQPDPTVHRRRLRSELRKTREAAQLTQRDVARAMDWSLSKLIRIETGAVSITTNDLRMLLAHYQISDQARVDALVEVARASRERSWWSNYREVASPEYVAFLGYESSASIIRNFEPLLVPGLLQTEEYARTVISVIRGPDVRKIDALVDLRMERQELLTRDGAPDTHFILDEAVIHRAVSGPDVMRRQLRHMRELAERPNVTIRVVPFAHGIYPLMRGAYVLFEFPDPEDEDVLYLETPEGEQIFRDNLPEDEGTQIKYLSAFWELEQIADKATAPTVLDMAIGQLASRSNNQPAGEGDH